MTLSPRPPKLLVLAVGLISAAALSYQILLLRLVAIIHWDYLASMLIALALLGYGASGAFLSRCRAVLLPMFGSMFTVNAVLFGVGTLACFRIAEAIPLNPLDLPSLRAWGQAMLIAVTLMPPFFFASNCIGLGFQRYPGGISGIYSADLLGAGLGAIAVVVLLFVLFPHKALNLVGFAGIAAAVLGYMATGPQPRWVASVSVLAVALLALLTGAGTGAPKPGDHKPLSQLLQVPGTELIKERSSPLGLLSVVRSRTVPLRHARGLSLNSRSVIPEQLAVFIDGEKMDVINRWDGAPESAAFLDEVQSALPYHLIAPEPRVLVVNAGGGTGVLQALAHGAQRVDALELNPQLIHLARRVYGGYAGHLYDHPRLELHFADARAYVGATASRYTLIQSPPPEGFVMPRPGIHAVGGSYRHTREALTEYLAHLEPEGLIAISHRVRQPPRDAVMLFATAVAALQANRSPAPERRLAWVRDGLFGTLLIKNGDFTDRDIGRVLSFCAERSFDIAYLPGPREPGMHARPEAGRDSLGTAAAALLGLEATPSPRNDRFDIAPPSDDRPYFSRFFGWSRPADSGPPENTGIRSPADPDYPVLIAALVQALALSALLILAPLPALMRGDSADADRPRRRRAAVYFGCIGLAFVIVEIMLVETLTLYLAHPLYAIPIVLAGFLLCVGVGSRFACRIPRRSARGRAVLAALALMLLLAAHLTLVPGLLRNTLPFPGAAKLTVVLSCVGPVAAIMGLLFPLGMVRLTYRDSALLPWGYTIYSCAAVVGAVLTPLLSIHFGRTVTVSFAMLLYGMAARFAP